MYSGCWQTRISSLLLQPRTLTYACIHCGLLLSTRLELQISQQDECLCAILFLFKYIIGNSQFINVIRISDNSNFTNIELTRANFGTDIVISPSLDFVYITSNQVFESFGALNVIDVASNKVIKQLSLADSPERLAINTGGSRMYVSNSNPDIVEVIQTSDNTLLTSVNAGGNGALAIAVTP